MNHSIYFVHTFLYLKNKSCDTQDALQELIMYRTYNFLAVWEKQKVTICMYMCVFDSIIF